MKKYAVFLLLAFLVTPSFAKASVLYSQSITLSPGWNTISTPKVLESHVFSAAETSNNFDIYTLNSSKPSGWATLADLNQTEFTPLFGYFINNKTGVTQTLTFNYKNVSIGEQFFSRIFPTSGWYSFGIANSTYAKNLNSDNTDINNPDNILNSLIDSSVHYGDVVDFTDASYLTNKDSVAVISPWKDAVRSASIANNTEVNTLNDFRELKGYAIYIKDANTEYSGFQNTTIFQCSDGIDNDGDGSIDMIDIGCNSNVDNLEYNLPVALTVSKETSSPIAQTVKVSNTASTSDIPMLVFKLKNTGADMTFDAMSFKVDASTSPLAMIGELTLKEGGNTVATWTPTSATTGPQTVTFNLDNTYKIPEDSTKIFTVVAKINDIDNFTAGTLDVSYLSASYEITNTKTILASVSGSAVGETQTFFSTGAAVKFVSEAYTAAVSGTSPTEGSIAITFTVEAVGDNDVVIKENGSNVLNTLVLGAGVDTQNTLNTIVTESGVSALAGNFTVSSGDVKTFTVTRRFSYAPGFVILTLNSVAGSTVSNVKTAAH